MKINTKNSYNICAFYKNIRKNTNNINAMFENIGNENKRISKSTQNLASVEINNNPINQINFSKTPRTNSSKNT